MKFTVKVGKIDGVKSEGKVEWSNEKKAGEIKVRYEEGQKVFLVGLVASAQGSGEPKGELSVGELRKISAKLGKRVKEEDVKTLALLCPETGLNPVMDYAEALVLGLLLGEYEFKKYKSNSTNLSNLTNLEEVTLVVKNANELVKTKEAVVKAEIYSQAVFLARDLVNEPSSLTTPSYLADLAQKMAKTDGFSCKVYGEKEMAKMGMGCLLGVAKGSDEPARFIKLEYLPVSSRAQSRDLGRSRTIVLVGKGVTFDTGGLSLKPADGMETMKMDMAGAAAILAIFSVLEKLKPKVHVIGLMPCTENMPSGKAVKPGDILKSYSGKTVEVLNTDAEGRLILADALSYGVTLNPNVMIDLATLTGACMVALGEEIAGLFTKDEKLKTELLAAAGEAGEKIWPLPLEENYEESLKSNVADLKNVTGKKYGGAITAALFLQEFTGKTNWAHLDIAGPAWEEKGTDLIPKGGSGFGVRTMLNFLQKV